VNWKEEIVKLVYVKQLIAERDTRRLWPHHLPEVAATGEEIAVVERHLGFALDDKYKRFLLFANGWRGFYQSVDLFGTADLTDSMKALRAREMAKNIDPAAWAECGENRGNVLIIAATPVDLDVFFITGPSGRVPGTVHWFAGTLIETFSNFEEYFLAMADYNRAELRDLSQ
jgi:hypothetical protein